MPSTVRPRGPLPARVYWTRRLIVLGVPLLLVVVLARVLGGSSDGKDPASGTATQAGATVETSAAPTADPSAGATTGKKGKKGKKKRNQETAPPEPVLAEPTGPCADSDIVATPALTSAPGGSDIAITINLRTVVTAACTWQASPETLTVTITSGDDYIWSTRECPVAIPVQDVVIRQAVDAPVVVTWSAKRSDETCSDRTEWAQLGFYHVEAAALGGDGTDVQFELVAPTAGPTAEVATGRKGKKQRDQETVPPEPVLAEPSGPCVDSDIVATPAITSATGGADVPITLNLRTVTAEACTWQASPQTLTVTITSGNDFIWSTRECPSAIAVQDVVIRQAVDTPVVVTWADGKRSDETCSGRTDWARPGFYHVEAAALGGDGTDVPFELVAPTPAVVTKTAEPQQQGGKKKDRSHTPGQDGPGNSVG